MGGDNGGGYVGGFLQLFDWNSKTRKKKLFASKPDFLLLTDQSKQKKPNLPSTTLFYLEVEKDDESSVMGGGGYSCASSVINDDDQDHGYGIKAPSVSVIARLMGLESSLPTSNFQEQEQQETPKSLHKMMQHQHQQPIEKFQTETLSRKSAKSIPITQHKLLSPIKSPGFVPSYKDAAQIMEAATKIIEPALHATSTTQKVVKLLPSSVPLKTKDLKEKAAAAATVSIGGCSSSNRRRTRNGPSSDSDKEKSVSLAIQAKVNVQRREGILRQINTNISSQPPNKIKKTSSIVVLKQNNQKQNCHRQTEKDNNYLASNNSTSQGRRRSSLPLDSSSSLRKFSQDGHDDYGRKQTVSLSSSSITKTVSQKKRLIGADNRNDIVSFTFTAPMMTTSLRQQTDDLSALLEQKLRELTNVAQSSSASSSVSEFQDQDKIQKKIGQRFPYPNNICSTSTAKVWELEYVEEILSGVELMIEDYAIGRSKKIINPHLFHQIETPTRVEDQIKKLLFDCVGESMELRCLSAGGWKAALSFERRRRKTLAEEVYGEISGWRIRRGGGEDSIVVDDLVDRDMSSPYGKWLDFEIEMFQIGVEIQGNILNTLMNQAIADMIASNSKL